MNEIVRRVDPKKRTMGQLIREDFMPALKNEYYLGLPRHLEPRVSRLFGYPAFSLAADLANSFFQNSPLPRGFQMLLDRKSPSFRATAGSNPFQMRVWPYTHNRREIWVTEGPSYGGITNSASVRFIRFLVDQSQRS